MITDISFFKITDLYFETGEGYVDVTFYDVDNSKQVVTFHGPPGRLPVIRYGDPDLLRDAG